MLGNKRFSRSYIFDYIFFFPNNLGDQEAAKERKCLSSGGCYFIKHLNKDKNKSTIFKMSRANILQTIT